uniref:CASP-like protein n=1 Tax=Populus trichocarpa TaxID=3694 RepID=A0A2K2A1C9_POPTR
MATTSDFRSVTAKGGWLRLVTATVQILWSLSVAVVDIYTLLVRRSLRKLIILRLFAIGAMTFTLAFAAACASAGIENDLSRCSVNPCARLETATAMAYISRFAILLNF